MQRPDRDLVMRHNKCGGPLSLCCVCSRAFPGPFPASRSGRGAFKEAQSAAIDAKTGMPEVLGTSKATGTP